MLLLLLLARLAFAASTVENVRIWSENNKTRVVLDLSKSVQHNIFTLRGPDRLVIDLKDSRLAKSLTAMPQGAGAVRSIRSAVRSNGQLRVVLDLEYGRAFPHFHGRPQCNLWRSAGHRPAGQVGAPSTVKRASEEYRPGRDIVIAIDAGHGGQDPGAIGQSAPVKKTWRCHQP